VINKLLYKNRLLCRVSSAPECTPSTIKEKRDRRCDLPKSHYTMLDIYCIMHSIVSALIFMYVTIRESMTAALWQGCVWALTGYQWFVYSRWFPWCLLVAVALHRRRAVAQGRKSSRDAACGPDELPENLPAYTEQASGPDGVSSKVVACGPDGCPENLPAALPQSANFLHDIMFCPDIRTNLERAVYNVKALRQDLHGYNQVTANLMARNEELHYDYLNDIDDAERLGLSFLQMENRLVEYQRERAWLEDLTNNCLKRMQVASADALATRLKNC